MQLRIRPDWTEWPEYCCVAAAAELASWHLGSCAIDRIELAKTLETRVPEGSENPLGLEIVTFHERVGLDLNFARSRLPFYWRQIGCPLALRTMPYPKTYEEFEVQLSIALGENSVVALGVAWSVLVPSLDESHRHMVIIDSAHADRVEIIDTLSALTGAVSIATSQLFDAAAKSGDSLWVFERLEPLPNSSIHWIEVETLDD